MEEEETEPTDPIDQSESNQSLPNLVPLPPIKSLYLTTDDPQLLTHVEEIQLTNKQTDPHTDPHSDPRTDPHTDPRTDPHTDPRTDPHTDQGGSNPEGVTPTRPHIAGATPTHSTTDPMGTKPLISPRLHIALRPNQSDSTDHSMESSSNIDMSTQQTVRVSTVVKELSVKICNGDTSTHWFHKILLLDHIDHVHQKMLKCLDEIDLQMEGKKGNNRK